MCSFLGYLIEQAFRLLSRFCLCLLIEACWNPRSSHMGNLQFAGWVAGVWSSDRQKSCAEGGTECVEVKHLRVSRAWYHEVNNGTHQNWEHRSRGWVDSLHIGQKMCKNRQCLTAHSVVDVGVSFSGGVQHDLAIEMYTYNSNNTNSMLWVMFTFVQSSVLLIIQVRQQRVAPPTPSLKPPTRQEADVSSEKKTRDILKCLHM